MSFQIYNWTLHKKIIINHVCHISVYSIYEVSSKKYQDLIHISDELYCVGMWL